MSKIEIYFGNPTSEKEWEWIEKYSERFNIGIEKSVLKNFSSFFESLCTSENDGSTYFELVICSIDGDAIKLPKMTVSTYKNNGFILPMLVIHGYYGIDKDTNNPIFITDEFINAIGKDCELEFSHDYYGFQRVGEINLMRNEVTYLVQGKKQIFHEGKFLPVKKEPNSAK
jgi:hypothetical protein